jgi:transposase
MQSISTIGLDIAKSVFQVHGVDAAGQVILRRQLRRRYVLVLICRCFGDTSPKPSMSRMLIGAAMPE